jgi:hypothetical protein
MSLGAMDITERRNNSARRIVHGLLVAAAAISTMTLGRLPAFAGSFTLFEGKQYDLCREYAKNLAAFPDLSDKTYEWPLDPKLKDFSKPQWVPVDVRQHTDIVKAIYVWNYRGYAGLSAEQMWQSRSSEVDADIAQTAVRLDMVNVDLYHIGRTGILYRYFHKLPDQDYVNYGGTQRQGYWYLYKSDVDPRLSDAFNTYSTYGQFFDSVLYKGRFYLVDLGRFGRKFATTLMIDEPGANVEHMEASLLSVCLFRYQR